MVGAKSRRLAKEAIDRAEANVRRYPQRRYSDLRKFEIFTTATGAQLIALMTERREHYVTIAAFLVGGIPVTPPESAGVTFHIVVLKNAEADAGDGPNDVVAVELLVSEHDNYFRAFRPITRFHNEDDPSGWFIFEDTNLPDFLKKNPLNRCRRDHVFKLKYDSGYSGQGTVKVGWGSLAAVFSCYKNFNVDNCLKMTDDRMINIMVTMLFLGEGQRFPEVLTEFADYIENFKIQVLPKRLVDLTNEWETISAFSYRIDGGDKDAFKDLEKELGFQFDVEDLGMLVGPNSKVMLLKFGKEGLAHLTKKIALGRNV